MCVIDSWAGSTSATSDNGFWCDRLLSYQGYYDDKFAVHVQHNGVETKTHSNMYLSANSTNSCYSASIFTPFTYDATC